MYLITEQTGTWALLFLLPACVFVTYSVGLLRWSGRPWRRGALILTTCGLAFPFLIEPVVLATLSILEMMFSFPGLLGGLTESAATSLFLFGVVTGAGMYAATSSKRVFLVMALASLAVAGLSWIGDDRFDGVWQTVAFLYTPWHAAAAGSMWWWARCERIRRRADTGVCANCGYDLAGLLGDLCPECGETIRSGSAIAQCETPKPPGPEEG